MRLLVFALREFGHCESHTHGALLELSSTFPLAPASVVNSIGLGTLFILRTPKSVEKTDVFAKVAVMISSKCSRSALLVTDSSVAFVIIGW